MMASTVFLAGYYGLRLDASEAFIQGYVDGMRLDQRGQGVACGAGWIPRTKKCSPDKAKLTSKEAKAKTVEKARERAKLKSEVKAAKGQKPYVKPKPEPKRTPKKKKEPTFFSQDGRPDPETLTGQQLSEVYKTEMAFVADQIRSSKDYKHIQKAFDAANEYEFARGGSNSAYGAITADPIRRATETESMLGDYMGREYRARRGSSVKTVQAVPQSVYDKAVAASSRIRKEIGAPDAKNQWDLVKAVLK